MTERYLEDFAVGQTFGSGRLRIEPERVLRQANAKFARRFAAVERKLAGLGRSPAQSTLAEMDRFWEEVKAEERQP